ncbi:STAS domain-containing protein [Actinoplanes sp. NEAU-A12]|uniref:STAS domain-containing protein n=1 Tax=Actinoplanes sandaracinus TaxID=3045177 RepID=A0ABT6WTI9_9ACTN|nr:STAS domain-containing protein [Actinoplanes sandaracinus]MDI6103058.1 STAS domain-containing protein [Actinoplanes sandaracinus]
MPVVTTPPFTISSHETPTGLLRVSLSGEFDMSVGDALSRALVDAARRPGVTRVIVDLEHTRLIDSHAVAGLVAGYEAAAAVGRGFTVVNGGGLVQQVLDVTGLSEVLCEQP